MEGKNIHIFALAAHGLGISGSDRIFIKFAERWNKYSKILIHVWEEGYQMCRRQHLEESNITFLISKMELWRKLGFVVNYFARIIEGIRLGLTIKLRDPQKTIVYSASDFWMDCLPCIILKLRYTQLKWVAAWYQTAPFPWKGFSEGERKERYYMSSLLYWLMQFPMKPIIGSMADLILINNEEEKKVFPKQDKEGKLMVVLGAVDIKQINTWKSKLGNQIKVYDAVFQGRFHPQKGVMELIDIWKLVVDKRSDAKLIMIGDGPLMESVKLKIKKEGLENNIKLAGYLFDGEEKYKIFSQSRIVAHPAFYDSGGMAAAEAMAFGMPAVGFNLKSFKSYYPQGMIKINIGDIRSFADTIIELLDNVKERTLLGKEALQMIERDFSWDQRAEEAFLKFNSLQTSL